MSCTCDGCKHDLVNKIRLAELNLIESAILVSEMRHGDACLDDYEADSKKLDDLKKCIYLLKSLRDK